MPRAWLRQNTHAASALFLISRILLRASGFGLLGASFCRRGCSLSLARLRFGCLCAHNCACRSNGYDSGQQADTDFSSDVLFHGLFCGLLFTASLKADCLLAISWLVFENAFVDANGEKPMLGVVRERFLQAEVFLRIDVFSRREADETHPRTVLAFPFLELHKLGRSPCFRDVEGAAHHEHRRIHGAAADGLDRGGGGLLVAL